MGCCKKDEASMFCKINKRIDESDAVQEKHTPIIKVDGTPKAGQPFQVTIDVGGGKHPNEHGHFIEWVNLTCCDLPLAHVQLTDVMTYPIVSVMVMMPHAGECTLKSQSRCNLHGVWEGELKVTISE